jgi:translation initiation factor 1
MTSKLDLRWLILRNKVNELAFDMDDILAELDKEKQALRISVDRRKYGKKVTLLSGFGANKNKLKTLAKKLKKTLGCGGTVTESNQELVIELQGDWRSELPELLEKEGYNAEEITIRK